MKTPSIQAVKSLLINLKYCIHDDFRAHEEDTIPSMLVTVACDNDGGWTYQTGDLQFSGSAYFYPHWATTTLYRRSNCLDLARTIIDELKDSQASN